MKRVKVRIRFEAINLKTLVGSSEGGYVLEAARCQHLDFWLPTASDLLINGGYQPPLANQILMRRSEPKLNADSLNEVFFIMLTISFTGPKASLSWESLALRWHLPSASVGRGGGLVHQTPSPGPSSLTLRQSRKVIRMENVLLNFFFFFFFWVSFPRIFQNSKGMLTSH